MKIVGKRTGKNSHAKLTGKHLCQSLFCNTFVGLSKPATLLETLAQVFSCEFCEISINT